VGCAKRVLLNLFCEERYEKVSCVVRKMLLAFFCSEMRRSFIIKCVYDSFLSCIRIKVDSIFTLFTGFFETLLQSKFSKVCCKVPDSKIMEADFIVSNSQKFHKVETKLILTNPP